jgi:uncharacterized Fe-S center protein
MNTSKVYFTDMRTKVGESLLIKMDRLIQKAGIKEIDFKQKYVAIKIHFGEPGNLAFFRPNFAKTLADRIKKLGGMPFLTDCNTLYVGRRGNGLNHLEAAAENGYTFLSTGCQNIIADGVRGTDEVEVKVKEGEYCKTAHIGRAIMDADIIISLNHFKGHEGSGFGGAIKNIGMGSGSRAGKMAMHNDGKPYVKSEVCVGCKICARFCAHEAIGFNGSKASINQEKCVGCGHCIGACSKNAIVHDWDSSNKALSCKLTEYCKAVLDGRPNFHISVVNNVSPYCDCHDESDLAVVPDIGIFASFDPVALDKACIDAVNAAPGIASSINSDKRKKPKCEDKNPIDHFTIIHPDTDWRSQLSHGEKLGLGTTNYELVTVK